MHIEHLEVRNFRNLRSLSVDLPAGPVLFRGANAQGKTNILEALYVVATGKSFRSARPAELISHGELSAQLRARVQRQGVRHEVEVDIVESRRHVRVDGRNLAAVSGLLELVNVVAFFPDDLRIIKGSPEERRSFLDRSIANHRPDFVEATRAYQHALKARNALLKADTFDRKLLAVYTPQLVRYGEQITQARREALAALEGDACHLFQQVMGSMWRAEFRLTSGVPNDEGVFADAFERALQASLERDRASGITHAGPHRADLLVTLDGQPARQYASQGQQRALVLSLKLAEVRLLQRLLGGPPVLLLDDVSSELDAERTRQLFLEIVGLGAQVWISTTGAAPLPLPNATPTFQVEAGEINASS